MAGGPVLWGVLRARLQALHRGVPAPLLRQGPGGTRQPLGTGVLAQPRLHPSLLCSVLMVSVVTAPAAVRGPSRVSPVTSVWTRPSTEKSVTRVRARSTGVCVCVCVFYCDLPVCLQSAAASTGCVTTARAAGVCVGQGRVWRASLGSAVTRGPRPAALTGCTSTVTSTRTAWTPSQTPGQTQRRCDYNLPLHQLVRSITICNSAVITTSQSLNVFNSATVSEGGSVE